MIRIVTLLAGAAALAGLLASNALAAAPAQAVHVQLASNADYAQNDGDDQDSNEGDDQSDDQGDDQQSGDNPDVVPDADVDTAEREIRQQLHDARINVIRRGKLIVVSMGANILFTLDSYDVSNEGTAATRALARILVRRHRTTVEVNGYTDTSGSSEYNFQLSANRARAVSDILVSSGVDPSRIQAHGFGETHLAVQTGDEVKEIRNRRVEIVLHLGGRGHGRHRHRHH